MMKILQQNINRSTLATKELLNTINEMNCDLALLQEPACNNNNEIKGFSGSTTIINTNSPTERPRAIIAIFNSAVQHQVIQTSNEDICAVKFTNASTQCILISTYIPSNTDIRPHLIILRNILETHQNTPVIISGDTNCNHPIWGSQRYTTRGQILSDFISELDLCIFNSQSPTYQHQDGRKGWIDLTLANSSAVTLIANWKQLPFSSYSDHTAQNFDVNIVQYEQITQLTTWKYKETDVDWAEYADGFNDEHVDQLNSYIHDITTTADIDQCVARLTSMIEEAAQLCLRPQVKRKARISTKPFWWDRDVATLAKTVKHFKNKLHRTPIQLTGLRQMYLDKYLHYRSQLTKKIKKMSEESWRMFVADGDDSQGTAYGNAFRFLKSKLNHTKNDLPILNCDHSEIRNVATTLLNTFFPTDETTDETPENHDGVYEFDKHSFQQTNRLMKATNPKKSPGPDGMTNNMIKNAPHQMKLAMHNLFLACLRYGYFPLEWKASVVRVIPKPLKANYLIPSAYRPISLTPHLSKILERIINNHLIFHLKEFIHPDQHGFQPGKSTVTALHQILRNVPAPNKRKKRAIVTFDFRAAFDHAPHSAMLRALELAKVPIFLIRITESYLRKRKVEMRLPNNTIRHRIQGLGCPQGGVLSPTLWTVVINDLLMELTAAQHLPIAYADDLTVVCSATTQEKLQMKINSVIDIVDGWSRTTSIPINYDKSMVLHIGKFMCEYDQLTRIKVTNETKILGVIFTSNMKFNRHVNTKIEKAKKYLNKLQIFISHKYGLTSGRRTTLYNCYVKPSLIYASELWGDKVSENTLKKLTRTENQILRNAVHGFRSTSSDSVRALTDTPYIKDLIKARVEAFNARGQLQPTNIINTLEHSVYSGREETLTDWKITIQSKKVDNGEIGCKTTLEEVGTDRLMRTIHTRYKVDLAEIDAERNCLRKILKATRNQNESTSILIKTRFSKLVDITKPSVSKNVHAITELAQRSTIYVSRNTDLNLNFDPRESISEATKYSYNYHSLSKHKDQMMMKLRRSVEEARGRCRQTVQSACSNKHFSYSTISQAVTTFLTQHGPVRAYLKGMWNIGPSSDCPECHSAETYEHVTFHCPRFEDIHDHYDTRLCMTDIDGLVNRLINEQKLSDFCEEILRRLRLFNTNLRAV